MKKEICIGMAGAGRATELHLEALKRFSGIPFRLKHIVARRSEQVNLAKNRYGFEQASLDYSNLLNDDEIDVIDICTPPYMHAEMVAEALKAGKHVICEKPLTGYFGNEGDATPIGLKVKKSDMYASLLESIEDLRRIIEASDRKFLYAENFLSHL